MLILLTIILLIFIPLAMLILHLARPKFSIQGFLVVLAVLAAWPMVFLARFAIPQTITLLVWEPLIFFPISPTLLIDDIAWYFALALISLSCSVIITSIAQLGQSFIPPATQVGEKFGGEGDQESPVPDIAPGNPDNQAEPEPASNWQSWAGILVLTSLGLVAVTAGNLLTLLLVWTALDLIELVILLNHVLQSKLREQIVLAYAARLAGIGLVLLAGITPWSRGVPLSFDAVDQSTSVYLILAAGLRLGVFPLHLPLLGTIRLWRSLGTILRLVPAASSFILLVRVAGVGVPGDASRYLLVFTALVGLLAGIYWMNAKDELNGRPFWLLGSASLAVACAILNQPAACLAWSIASILSGGLVFSMSIRHRNLIPIALLALINFSALPYTTTWMGTALYQYPGSSVHQISPFLFYLFAFAFLLVHSLLLAGLFRHILRGILIQETPSPVHIERWVWFLYPLGLAFILFGHFLIGYYLLPNITEVPFISWIGGAVALILSVGIWYLSMRGTPGLPRLRPLQRSPPSSDWLSFNWLYALVQGAFRMLAGLSSLFSAILEGDGGILWSLVLFALIFVFLQR